MFVRFWGRMRGQLLLWGGLALFRLFVGSGAGKRNGEAWGNDSANYEEGAARYGWAVPSLGWAKDPREWGFKFEENWKRDHTLGAVGRPWYRYEASAAQWEWAKQTDRKYLRELAVKKPEAFLEEMTPNPNHTGLSKGLDLNFDHHRDLQKELRPLVEKVCMEKGLLNHPALGDKPLGPRGGGIKTPAVDIKKLQATIQALETENKAQAQSLQTALEQVAGLSEDKKTLQKSLSSVQKNLTILQGENTTLKDAKKLLQQEKNTLQKRVVALEAENTQLQRKLAAGKNPRPSLLRVWEGKYTLEGETPVYEPVGKKEEGCAIGFIAQTPKGKRYMAKLGLPDEEHQVSQTLSTRKRNFQRSIIAVITEKLAADVYALLGRGFFYVPKHRLARLEVLNPFTQRNELAIAVMQGLNKGSARAKWTITQGVHLLSRWMEQYQNIDTLTECMLYEGDETAMPFMECLNAGHVPQYAKIDGHTVPILGLMEIMAASRLLADTDVLGGGGKNAGYIIEREGDRPVAVRMVKIDAGEAFNFSGENNQLMQSFNMLSRAAKLKDPKDMQFGNMQPVVIQWARLAPMQKQHFLHALKRGLDFLRNRAVVDFLIHRRGEFDRAAEGDRILLIDKLVAPFKEAWQAYREAQTLPQVYGDVITNLEPMAPSQVPFRPKRYGAVDHKVDEAERLSLPGL